MSTSVVAVAVNFSLNVLNRRNHDSFSFRVPFLEKKRMYALDVTKSADKQFIMQG